MFIKNGFDLSWLAELWNSRLEWSEVKLTFVGALILLFDLVMAWCVWLIQQESIKEAGFPKRSGKYRTKVTKGYSISERILLVRLCREAEVKNGFLVFCLVKNFLNIAAFTASVTGYFGLLITHGAGWAFTLLLFPVFETLTVTTVISFIPDLIWLPSERKRYGAGRKRKK